MWPSYQICMPFLNDKKIKMLLYSFSFVVASVHLHVLLCLHCERFVIPPVRLLTNSGLCLFVTWYACFRAWEHLCKSLWFWFLYLYMILIPLFICACWLRTEFHWFSALLSICKALKTPSCGMWGGRDRLKHGCALKMGICSKSWAAGCVHQQVPTLMK